MFPHEGTCIRGKELLIWALDRNSTPANFCLTLAPWSSVSPYLRTRMKKIFLIGAGRSATMLIEYLLKHAPTENWEVTIGDVSLSVVLEKTKGHASARPIQFDIHDPAQTEVEVLRADIVISLLPAHMHLSVAHACVKFSKSLVTASYSTPDMEALHEEAIRKGVILLNECGLDPGIDHMSAMEIIRDINDHGGELNAFYSYTGGLVAPESNDNPWGYKFSWNPRNVILAGHGTARYIEKGKYKYIPYNRLFGQVVPVVVEGLGSFDGYANRDSLSYRKTYGIESIPTLLRGTLRQSGYCASWDIFVRLGLTDDTYVVENSESMTYAQLVESYLPMTSSVTSLEQAVADFCGIALDSDVMQRVLWTGLLSTQLIGLKSATPAQILQQLLEAKWKLKPGDKDMIVMQHRFEYVVGVKKFRRCSSLVVIGDDDIHTAMAKTVGLPVGIAARNILKGTITQTGVCIPVEAEICKPVLTELEEYGVHFTESLEELA